MKEVILKGEFDRFDNVIVSSVTVGTREEGAFFQGSKVEIDLPKVGEDELRSILESKYPDHRIYLMID